MGVGARAVYTFTDHHDYNGRKPFFSMNIIKTLENAPRDANKLRRFLQVSKDKRTKL
jgi:hypothetical protein